MNKEENENEGLDKLKDIKIIQDKWSKSERTCRGLGSQKCTTTWLSLNQSNVPGLSPVDRHSNKAQILGLTQGLEKKSVNVLLTRV